ncbi:hypothetical protein [Pseudoponticoccus marisrubri]|uniref:Uncharacterized protein n=1 Tax=Pseudoponticoccus marisrubri TaxID=1685382 RepID=A0A0W7WIN2_9RHOB|nr:hypothetical protein [Pseudoponticoccus marisrubri]KUF10475.1 hypothetical protein AVJ23_11345 [Pseudoponticoccus marisrubri]
MMTVEDDFRFNPVPMAELEDPMDSGTAYYDPDTLYGGSGHDTMVWPSDIVEAPAEEYVLAEEHRPTDDHLYLEMG